jgi:hypothetical protein
VPAIQLSLVVNVDGNELESFDCATPSESPKNVANDADMHIIHMESYNSK